MQAYYAHCTSLYNTPQEERDLSLIEELGFLVYNPNCEEADIAYKEHGMPWFKKKVEECDCLVFRSLPDGNIPAGVYKEIQWAKEGGRPVFELPSGLLQRELSVEETREYLREVGQR
jgi:hypothetical protein